MMHSFTLLARHGRGGGGRGACCGNRMGICLGLDGYGWAWIGMDMGMDMGKDGEGNGHGHGQGWARMGKDMGKHAWAWHATRRKASASRRRRRGGFGGRRWRRRPSAAGVGNDAPPAGPALAAAPPAAAGHNTGRGKLENSRRHYPYGRTSGLKVFALSRNPNAPQSIF